VRLLARRRNRLPQIVSEQARPVLGPHLVGPYNHTRSSSGGEAQWYPGRRLVVPDRYVVQTTEVIGALEQLDA
jgi:hypothetical protein